MLSGIFVFNYSVLFGCRVPEPGKGDNMDSRSDEKQTTGIMERLERLHENALQILGRKNKEVR